MVTDEELLKEGRLSEESELLLYNISLRQDDQRTLATDLLLSKLNESPAYQEMLKRDMITYEVFSFGYSPVARLRVTLKGLRYCVLHSEEIEPRRKQDIAGTPRRPSSDEAAEGEVPTMLVKGGSSVVYPMMALHGIPEHGMGLVLTDKRLDQISDIGTRRRASDRVESRGKPSSASERMSFVSEDGVKWLYLVVDDSRVSIAGAEGKGSLYAPAVIEGRKVAFIEANALSRLAEVEEIVCPDSVEWIGDGAFRGNKSLRRIVLPPNMSTFKGCWTAQCPNLAELVLPGKLEKVDRSVFENERLQKLVIGEHVRHIEPGSFQRSQLRELEIVEANPHFITDGQGIYSKDFSTLVALMRPTRCLTVREGCCKIGPKCCHGRSDLEEVILPEGVAEIGVFAFSGTGLRSFDAPSTLREIGEKAFFNCRKLLRVNLNEGLRTIGDSAFQASSIASLALPASIKSIGRSVTRNTSVVHSGPHCSISIDENCKDQFLDGKGGLYRRCEDGVCLVQLIDEEAQHYEVFEGAVAIDPLAFAYHDHIESVRLASTVRTIGESAFRICRKLRKVELSESLVSIGEEAFLDTAIEELRLPAALVELGDRALVTYGAHFGKTRPSLARVEVSGENGAFFMRSGMLCRRMPEGASVVVYTGSDPQVEFPDEITQIEDYAFSNANGIEYLSLNPGLSFIGASGLSPRCWIQHIHVGLSSPLEGRTSFDFYFPNTANGIRGITLGLGGANWVNVAAIAEQLDLCLANAHNYNSPDDPNCTSAYEHARLVLKRFDDPIMLSAANREGLEKLLRDNIVDVCVDVVLHDDRYVLDSLIERGFVNADNLDAIIEKVASLRDAANSAYLLEAKRRRFSRKAFDYEI